MLPYRRFLVVQFKWFTQSFRWIQVNWIILVWAFLYVSYPVRYNLANNKKARKINEAPREWLFASGVFQGVHVRKYFCCIPRLTIVRIGMFLVDATWFLFGEIKICIKLYETGNYRINLKQWKNDSKWIIQ